jgi:hypothetical protein
MCNKCGEIKFNQMLLRKYKPKEVTMETIKQLKKQYEIDRPLEIRQLVKEGKFNAELAEYLLKEK